MFDKTLSRILYIDLSKRRFWIEQRDELFRNWLGGTGVATQLLLEECPQGCDPLGPDNSIILAVGPLTGYYPLASKTVAMFKSPHTGNLGESHCGGRSALSLRLSGFGAIVIRGQSSMPVYLSIYNDTVFFRDATTLWGMGSSITAGRVIREQEPGAGSRTIMRIGRAGENLVSYACVTAETYRHFGRLGLGAVFGSKKLKALLISGKRSLQPVNKKEYRKLYDQIYKGAVDTELMRKYHDLGTAENILPLNSLKSLPTKNLQQSTFAHAVDFSGEKMASDYLGRRLACSHCPIGCIHIAALREPYEDVPYFFKTSMIGYDFEPIYALGSMLGGTEVPGFLKLMDTIEAVGVDVMSAGVILAWVTEAFERKLIAAKETEGLIPAWGDYKTYGKIVHKIVEQPNDFYSALAHGVEVAAQKYGGLDFALAFGKNEMPGYHTGPAAHLGFLSGARHSHLDNAGYSLDQKTKPDEKMDPKKVATDLVKEEAWRQILSSIVICFFARKVYSPEIVSEALKTAGFDISMEELKILGKKIYQQKYAFKSREGFTLDNIRIPKRIFETPALIDDFDEQFMRQALSHIKEQLT